MRAVEGAVPTRARHRAHLQACLSALLCANELLARSYPHPTTAAPPPGVAAPWCHRARVPELPCLLPVSPMGQTSAVLASGTVVLAGTVTIDRLGHRFA